MIPENGKKNKNILFISSNDGSDMRINKEIKSLHAAGAGVYFVGVKSSPENCFVKPFCREVFLVDGPRNTPASFARLFFTVLRILLSRRIGSVHVINEQLMIFFYPLLFFRHTVLDLFDSLFLKYNHPGNSLSILKWLVYLPVNRIIVTDERRLSLMPDFAKSRCSVLPNYPHLRPTAIRRERTGPLCLLYNGWMGKNRGTEIIEGLLATGLPMKVIMAGWFSDEDTRLMVQKNPQSIEFRGVVPQEIALEWAENEADYILCVYAPVNENNINASPNKIYDAIHTGTPLIVNREIGISAFTSDNGLGIVLPSYTGHDFISLYHLLTEKRNSFSWDKNLTRTYSWDNAEQILLRCHHLK
jgi:hypothetical protein